MKFLFVLAHPEPASFTSSLARHGMEALEEADEEVEREVAGGAEALGVLLHSLLDGV